MFGDRWHFFEVLSAIAQWMTGLVLFLIWLAVVLLFVRFLLIATRAAKVYLRSQGEHDGLLPARAATPTAPAPAAAAPASAPRTARPATTAPTKPTPKPRTPKTPAV